MKQNLKAAVYIRHNGRDLEGEFYEEQLNAIEEYSKQNNIQIVASYRDAGVSGKSTKGRNGFNQMIDDSSKGLFNLVLVYNIDRFTRSSEDYYTYYGILKDNGVDLISLASQAKISSLRQSLHELFISSTGAWLFMKICLLPYGYKRDGKKIIIDEEQAEVVKLVFEKYADGYGLYDLYYFLKEEGFKTKRGLYFNPSSISKMLNNEAYIGNFIYNKTNVIKVDGKKKRIFHNKSEWKVVPNAYPPIVDSDTFAKVQEIKQFWDFRIKGSC